MVKNKVGDLDYSKTKTTFEGWYYFNNNRIIKQETYGRSTFGNEQQEISIELIEAAKENIRRLTSKK